jgi:hypothetical protein
MVQPKIKVEKLEDQSCKITALASLDSMDEKGKMRFIFELNPTSKKIKKLEIQLVS